MRVPSLKQQQENQRKLIEVLTADMSSNLSFLLNQSSLCGSIAIATSAAAGEDVFNVVTGVFDVSIILSWGRRCRGLSEN